MPLQRKPEPLVLAGQWSAHGRSSQEPRSADADPAQAPATLLAASVGSADPERPEARWALSLPRGLCWPPPQTPELVSLPPGGPPGCCSGTARADSAPEFSLRTCLSPASF